MPVHAAADILVSLHGWEEPLGGVQGLPLLLAWGHRCQSQTLPQEELAGITSSHRVFALQDRLLHLMSWSQETVLRHFRAFLPHLEADDSHHDWQHYSCVLYKQAHGEQESALCTGNIPWHSQGRRDFCESRTSPAGNGHGIS